MLTPDGQAMLLELLAGAGEAAVVRVWESDSNFADAPLDEGFPKVEEGEVVFQATFGREVGNFDWKRHGVVVGQRVIDSTDADLGTKVSGNEWEMAARVSFAALAPSGG